MQVMSERKPSTTTHAILGLIAGEPASAYELAKRMQLTYSYFWPGARSHVFTEVKKLEALGWVAGEIEANGRRRRTTYAITRKGRQALALWLQTPPERFALEMEGLVRVYLASFGTDDDLDRAVAAMEASADTMLRIAGRIIPAYLEGRPPPPAAELHVRAILIDFLAGFAGFVDAWAKRSRKEIARWPEGDAAARDRRALRTLKSAPRRPQLEKKRLTQLSLT
jgi:DNA-binding PadR family transcriptional regulator